jgi:hypothetical protein
MNIEFCFLQGSISKCGTLSKNKIMNTGVEFLAMKNLLKSAVILFVLINFSCATQSPVSAQQGYVSTQVFYDELGPYGQWIDNPNYGYVWIPEVNQDFSPYSTSGYWAMTEYGWTWVSDYSWGWAPFHYGRWDFDNSYGWFWVPGNEWGPSWVNWRSGNGYYGWSPMRPGSNINMSFGNDYRDSDHWYFVRERGFGRQDMHRYYANTRDNNTIFMNSTVINNTYIDQRRNTTYISGPSRNDVQQVTGRRISNVPIRDYDRPGQLMDNSQMRIYRPQIQNTGVRLQQPSPSRITNINDVVPASERNTTNQRNNSFPTENRRREPQQQTTPQRQMDNQRQTQRREQTGTWNQQQRQQQPEQDRRRQYQQQPDRQNQQKQQINEQIRENINHQRQNTREKIQTQTQDQQRRVQPQQQDDGRRSNQEQQVKQQSRSQQQFQQQRQTTDPSNTRRRERMEKNLESSEKKKSN